MFRSVSVHIREENYRRMIRELVAEEQASPTGDLPKLIVYQHGNDVVSNGVEATLVEIREFLDWNFDVVVIPLARVRLRDVVERPNGGSLFVASFDIIT